MQGCCEPQPLDTLPPPQAAMPGRGQADSQEASVPIFVKGLEHVSEMQGRDGSGPICGSHPGSGADLCHVLKGCPGSPPLPAATRGPSETSGAPTADLRTC